MRFLVTGSSGFLGGYIKEEIKTKGHTFESFDITDGLDICNLNDFKKISCSADTVIHLASRTFVPESFENPHPFFNIGLTGTLNVLEHCRLNGLKVVYVSSYVYGPPQQLPITEEHPVISFNPYSASKIMGEQLCQYYNDYWKLPVSIVRPFNIYGFGQKENFLIPQLIRQAINGKIEVNDIKPKRDYVHVRDVAGAIISISEKQTDGCNTYNIGSGTSHSVKEIIDIITSRFNNVELVCKNKTRPNEVMDTIADITKIKKEICWEPAIGLKSGIFTMISSYLSNVPKHE